MENPHIQSGHYGPGEGRHRWLWAGFFLAWTGLGALVIWWLAAHPLEPSFVINPSTTAKPWGVRLREGFELVRINFDWVWRWGLLAPYVLWLASRFLLERGRWLRHGALLTLAGVAFVILSQTLVRRLGLHHSVVMVVSTQGKVSSARSNGGMFTASVQGSGGGGEMRWNNRFIVRSNVVAGQFPTNLESDLPPGALPNLHYFVWSNAAAGGPPPREMLSQTLASNLLPMLKDSLPLAAGGVIPGRRTAPLSVAMDSLAYLALLGLTHAVHYHRRYREREQQALLLSTRLNEARLRALQAQLQPHFLFNALNGIATLVRRDPPAAHEMLTSLSELLRLALSRSERQEMPLREEMEFLDRYVEIQRMRFGNRLQVLKELAPETLECLVPALLLQPLVENAIRHGIEPSLGPGQVRLASARDGEWLLLSVQDNGVGLTEPLPAQSAPGAGLGLASVRERLRALYGERHEFNFAPGPAGGVTVRIRLPFQVAARPVPALESVVS